jgi:hypothetical protein
MFEKTFDVNNSIVIYYIKGTKRKPFSLATKAMMSVFAILQSAPYDRIDSFGAVAPWNESIVGMEIRKICWTGPTLLTNIKS